MGKKRVTLFVDSEIYKKYRQYCEKNDIIKEIWNLYGKWVKEESKRG